MIYFDRVDVVSNDDQLGLFLLDQSGDSVDTASGDKWTLGWLIWLASSTVSSSLLETGLSVLLGLWSVLIKQLE